MRERDSTFRNFIASFGDHWFDAMSGGASVPFAIATVFVAQTYQKLLLAGAAILCFVVAAYRVWRTERIARNAAESRGAVLESEYPYSLRVGAIDYNLVLQYVPKKNGQPSNKISERRMGFTIHISNTLSRPIEYRFKKIAVDGVETSLGNSGEVVSANTSTQFTTETVLTQPIVSHSPEQFVLELEYVYGEPGNLTRHVKKRIRHSIFHNTKRTAYGYDSDEEKEWSASSAA
jgi:hypothetical protein